MTRQRAQALLDAVTLVLELRAQCAYRGRGFLKLDSVLWHLNARFYREASGCNTRGGKWKTYQHSGKPTEEGEGNVGCRKGFGGSDFSACPSSSGILSSPGAKCWESESAPGLLEPLRECRKDE